ncbi:N-acetyltransferase [Amycolatopsis sp. YIM 10]|uniref:GNAT family N-acetyltransferase n=1 Tax=Amycolatopsis sp. YIM 10 TaxID=2653857 RepID=UPI0012904D7A|nr:GNAT family N-acetyltransferase [Amycolatopsis sp. YIM 10]QFU88337.1 Acetyltransferase (GNAT) family protein [Amycolatopsis sp. YIM 10]
MTPTVIVAVSSQVPDLVSSASDLFAEDAGHHDPLTDITWPQHHGTGYYADLVDRDDALCLLARTGGTTAGHLIGRVKQNNPLRPAAITATLESIRVDTAHRRRGTANALIDHFFDWARRQNANEAFVTAYAANSAGRSLYRGNGFEEFETKLRRAL